MKLLHLVGSQAPKHPGTNSYSGRSVPWPYPCVRRRRGYYARKQGGLAGVFRCATDGTDWKHALSEIEAFTASCTRAIRILSSLVPSMGSIEAPIAVKISAAPLSGSRRAGLVIPA